jgi:hypothetical protein
MFDDVKVERKWLLCKPYFLSFHDVKETFINAQTLCRQGFARLIGMMTKSFFE